MPDPTFESTNLPLPSSFNGKVVAPVSRTEMDSGYIRQQARFSTVQKEHSVSWEFSKAEYETFETFFHTTLEHGTLFFDLILPTSTGFEAKSVRFVGGEYGHRYIPHERYEVSAQIEEQVIQTVNPAPFAGVPLWFNPEVPLVSDIDAIPGVHENVLFTSNPGTGVTKTITVPAIASVSDRLPVGVMLTGAGSVTIRTEGETGGGGETPDPDFLAYLLTQAPWAVYDGSTTVQTSGSVTGWTDLSGNSRNLTDAQTGTSRCTTDGSHIVTTEAGRSLSATLASGTFPTKFHAFMLLKADADLIAEASDTFYVLSPVTSTSSNSYWGINIVAGEWSEVNAFSGGIRNTFRNRLDASKYILYELIRDTNDQDGYVNGEAAWSSGGGFPDASMTWSGIRIGAQNGNFNHESALIKTFAVFDCSTTWLTKQQILDIRAACYAEFPDTKLSPTLRD